MNCLHRSWFPTLLLIAYALRMLNLTGESLWRDEVDIVRFALLPLQNLLQNFPRAGFNGPLYLLLMRGWFVLSGVSDFSLRYFSLLFSMLLIALVYVMARRLFGQSAAPVAALLTAVSPVHIWYAGEGKMYTLQPALLVLALYAVLRALQTTRTMNFVQAQSNVTQQRQNHWWLVLCVSCTAAFYVHLLSPIVLLVMGAWVGLNWPLARRNFRRLFITGALLVLPYLPLLVWQLPSLLNSTSSGHAFLPLDTMALALLSDWSIGFGTNAPFFFLPQSDIGVWRSMLSLAFVVIAVGGALAQRSRAPRAVGMTITWLVVPILAVFLVSLRVPIFQPRYLLWCAPVLYTLMGGLRLPFASLRWGSYSAYAGIATLGIAAQIVTPIRPDVRGASAFIAAQARAGDVLIFQIPYGRHGVEYYLRYGLRTLGELNPDTLYFVEAPFTNYGLSNAEVTNQLWQNIGPARRIWLIETEAEMWDENGLVRQWFDNTLPLLQKKDFRGVRLSLHQTSLDKQLYLPTMQR